MSDPQTNYLKNTAPEQEERFVQVLRQIPLFKQLPEELMYQIFQYSKFVKLRDKQRCIDEGMFDQEIYVLIHGHLDVYLKMAAGGEELIDVVNRPFSLFGERCILGEPRGASMEARGDTLLLGIDLSSLPDVLEGVSAPESRLEDSAYSQNHAMYTVFAMVLVQRLDRLIKDQYKLMQKIMRLLESQSAWKKDVLLTTVFNQFCANQLLPVLEVHEVLQGVFSQNQIHSEQLSQLVANTPVNTEAVYMELVRLHMIGELEDLNRILFAIMRHIVAKAQSMREYMAPLQNQDFDLPELITLSNYCSTVYNKIINANMVVRPLSKTQFFSAFYSETKLDPSALTHALRDGGWVKDHFGQAYIMYLVCETTIHMVTQVNRFIAQYVKYLTTMNSPRQKTESGSKYGEGLVKELIGMYESHTEDSPAEAAEEDGSKSPQDDVEALLANLGL